MSRPRFPGCPEARFGKELISYRHCDQNLNEENEVDTFSESIQRGVREFNALFHGDGDSDEADFDGFTSADLEDAEHFLKQNKSLDFDEEFASKSSDSESQLSDSHANNTCSVVKKEKTTAKNTHNSITKAKLTKNGKYSHQLKSERTDSEEDSTNQRCKTASNENKRERRPNAKFVGGEFLNGSSLCKKQSSLKTKPSFSRKLPFKTRAIAKSIKYTATKKNIKDKSSGTNAILDHSCCSCCGVRISPSKRNVSNKIFTCLLCKNLYEKFKKENIKADCKNSNECKIMEGDKCDACCYSRYSELLSNSNSTSTLSSEETNSYLNNSEDNDVNNDFINNDNASEEGSCEICNWRTIVKEYYGILSCPKCRSVFNYNRTNRKKKLFRKNVNCTGKCEIKPVKYGGCRYCLSQKCYNIFEEGRKKNKNAEKLILGEKRTTPHHANNVESSIQETMETENIDISQDDSSEDDTGGKNGPRVKHVCRSASVVFGFPSATFEDENEPPAPRLSALPTNKKQRIAKKFLAHDSDLDELNVEREIPDIRKSNSPNSIRKAYRCGKCTNCKRKNCGSCINCKESHKFGRTRKDCLERTCTEMADDDPESTSERDFNCRKKFKAFEEDFEYSELSSESDSDEDYVTSNNIQENERKCPKSVQPSSSNPKSRNARINSGKVSPADLIKRNNQEDAIRTGNNTTTTRLGRHIKPKTRYSDCSFSTGTSSEKVDNNEKKEKDIKKNQRLKLLKSNKIQKKPERQEKIVVPPQPKQHKTVKKVEDKREKPVNKEKSRRMKTKNVICEENPKIDPKLIARLKWPQPTTDDYLNLDFNSGTSLSDCWEEGFSVITTANTKIPSVLCYLCGSIGNHNLIFCNVCCEPFHYFCLERDEKPIKGALETWICRKCIFCSACGGSKKTQELKKCKICFNAYHSNCAGQNHSSFGPQKSWICRRCVKCKNCGSNRPAGTSGKWYNDFTMCYKCSKSINQGNFCPICKCCYSDSIFDTKMLHCTQCDVRIHTSCMNVSDDIYEAILTLPDNLPFCCSRCCPDKEPLWLIDCRLRLRTGMNCTLAKLKEYQNVLEPLSQDSLVFCTEANKTKNRLRETYSNSLEDIEIKLNEDKYSVDTFCDEIVRIIRFNQNNCRNRQEKELNITDCVVKFLESMNENFPWFDSRKCRFWEFNQIFPDCMLPNACMPPSDDHTYASWMTDRKEVIANSNENFDSCEASNLDLLIKNDSRKCSFCQIIGDSQVEKAGRLLYAGPNDWVHVNCALWSAEVYENTDGQLFRVQTALCRGSQLKCQKCGIKGATVGCCKPGCTSNFHFMCARDVECVFQIDKKMFCAKHRSSISNQILSLQAFPALRRIFVNAESRKSYKPLYPTEIKVAVGSLTVTSLGHLIPLSDKPNYLLPNEFMAQRKYWSYKSIKEKMVYTIKLHLVQPVDRIEMKELRIIHDKSHPDFNADILKNYENRDIHTTWRNTEKERKLFHLDLDNPDFDYRNLAPKTLKLLGFPTNDNENVDTSSDNLNYLNSTNHDDLPNSDYDGDCYIIVNNGADEADIALEFDSYCQQNIKIINEDEKIIIPQVDGANDKPNTQGKYSNIKNCFVKILRLPEKTKNEYLKGNNNLKKYESSFHDIKECSVKLVRVTARQIRQLSRPKFLSINDSDTKDFWYCSKCYVVYKSRQAQDSHIKNCAFKSNEMNKNDDKSDTDDDVEFHEKNNVNDSAKLPGIQYFGKNTVKNNFLTNMRSTFTQKQNNITNTATKLVSNNTNKHLLPKKIDLFFQSISNDFMSLVNSLPTDQEVRSLNNDELIDKYDLDGSLFSFILKKANCHNINIQFHQINTLIVNQMKKMVEMKKLIPNYNENYLNNSLKRGESCEKPAVPGHDQVERATFEIPKKRRKISMNSIGKNEKSPDKSCILLHSEKRKLRLPDATQEIDVPSTDLLNLFGKNSDDKNKDPYLLYELRSEGEILAESQSVEEVWAGIFKKAADLRLDSNLPHLSFSSCKSTSFSGFGLKSVTFLTEQLFGNTFCRQYVFRTRKVVPVDFVPEYSNPSGCCRAEPYRERKAKDMFNFLLSKHRVFPTTSYSNDAPHHMLQKSQIRATASNLPLVMRLRHLPDTAKQAVAVHRSPIHGRGLFCLRDIEMEEMIIEYAGESIRAILADKREREYERKGIGCYMFRVDHDTVIDATMSGNAGRFINHSCEPNCYSKIIKDTNNQKRIVIFAQKSLKRGEELTYDYKFPLEDIKIPCLCDSKKCRKYLN